MADPRTLAEQAGRIRAIYGDAETILLNRVARRLARGITDPGWTEAKLAEVQALERELRQSIAGLPAAAQRELDDVLLNSYVQGHRSGYAHAGVVGPLEGELTRTHVAAVKALVSQTMSDFSRANITILRQSLDIYRSVIADSVGSAVAGSVTRQQATQSALDRWAMRGIRGFTDTAGRRWDLGSYSEMATRTAITRSHLEGRMGALRDLGYELFVVSGGQSSCPLCNEWAGRILSESPHPQATATVAQARSSGLFHPNCGHTIDLYQRGFTPPPPTAKERKADVARYEILQQQRGMERDLRAWKRREAVAITPDAQRKARAQIRERQARLRAFTQQHGTRRLYHREQPLRGVVG